jgi:nucleoid-associated protein YgaU
MNVEQKRAKIPFDYSSQVLGENSNSNLELFVTNQDFIVQDGGEINCNIDMEVLGNISENRSINLIDEVEQEESESNQDYSVVVYIVKPGDTLWNIAKRFRTTVDFIVRTNGIENPDKIDVGQKLYIPRYSKIAV